MSGSDRKQTNAKDETLADWLEERGKELDETYGLAAFGVEPVTHCPTGIRRLDDAGLLELGVATIVLGHEGDGKSALGLQFLEGCARGGFDALGFWPEDPRRFVADRVYAPIIGESATKLRRARVDDPGSIPERLKVARRNNEDWTKRIGVCDRRLTPESAIAELRRRWTKVTRLAVFDYAQVFGDEGDDGFSSELSGFIWNTNEFAKDVNGAVVILSQVRGKVKERGRKLFDDWKWNHKTEQPTASAVEGYRPLSGDAAWAPGAMGQKARSILSWFRPNSWLREHGASVPDNVAEALVIKNNYGESKQLVRLSWDGPTTRISDPKEVCRP